MNQSSDFNADVIGYLEAKVDNALQLCYNDSRQKAVDILLDLKNELKNVREMVSDEENLATSL